MEENHRPPDRDAPRGGKVQGHPSDKKADQDGHLSDPRALGEEPSSQRAGDCAGHPRVPGWGLVAIPAAQYAAAMIRAARRKGGQRVWPPAPGRQPARRRVAKNSPWRADLPLTFSHKAF